MQTAEPSHTSLRLCRMMRCKCTRTSCQRSAATIELFAFFQRCIATADFGGLPRADGAADGRMNEMLLRASSLLLAGEPAAEAPALPIAAAVDAILSAEEPVVAVAACGSKPLKMWFWSTSSMLGRSVGSMLSSACTRLQYPAAPPRCRALPVTARKLQE